MRGVILVVDGQFDEMRRTPAGAGSRDNLPGCVAASVCGLPLLGAPEFYVGSVRPCCRQATGLLGCQDALLLYLKSRLLHPPHIGEAFSACSMPSAAEALPLLSGRLRNTRPSRV